MITSKRLYGGTLTDTSATLYTTPALTGNYTIVKSLVICNKTTLSQKVTILLNSIEILSSHVISPNETVVIPNIDQILQNGESISGYADTIDSINCYISGKEVT